MRSPVPLAAVLLLAASCSFNAQCGGARIDRTRTAALVRTLGEAVDTVASTSCPADVKAEVGSTFECTATFADGSVHPAVVTVTSVDGSDIKADATWKKPLFGAKKKAEIEASIAEVVGVKGALECKPGVVALAVDERMRCTVRGPTDQAPVDVWFAAGDKINWKINPDAPDVPAAPAPAAPAAEAPAAPAAPAATE